jgi:hypothetical protein
MEQKTKQPEQKKTAGQSQNGADKKPQQPASFKPNDKVYVVKVSAKQEKSGKWVDHTSRKKGVYLEAITDGMKEMVKRGFHCVKVGKKIEYVRTENLQTGKGGSGEKVNRVERYFTKITKKCKPAQATDLAHKLLEWVKKQPKETAKTAAK